MKRPVYSHAPRSKDIWGEDGVIEIYIDLTIVAIAQVTRAM
jgi:hypothetical protein